MPDGVVTSTNGRVSTDPERVLMSIANTRETVC